MWESGTEEVGVFCLAVCRWETHSFSSSLLSLSSTPEGSLLQHSQSLLVSWHLHQKQLWHDFLRELCLSLPLPYFEFSQSSAKNWERPQSRRSLFISTLCSTMVPWRSNNKSYVDEVMWLFISKRKRMCALQWKLNLAESSWVGGVMSLTATQREFFSLYPPRFPSYCEGEIIFVFTDRALVQLVIC